MSSNNCRPVQTSACTTLVAQLRCSLVERDPLFFSKLEETGETPDDTLLQRWLEYKQNDVEATADALSAHAAWRIAFITEARLVAAQRGLPPTHHRLPEGSVSEELSANKVFLQGHDRYGHPVVVIKAAGHDMRTRDLTETNRLIAYTLDNASLAGDLSKDPNGRLCCIIDLLGLAPRNCDYKALLAIFEMLQSQYPERLATLFFIDAPFIFWGVWRIVSPFVPERTRAKLKFISGEAGRDELRERMERSVLPKEWGGDAELVPIESAVIELLMDKHKHEGHSVRGAAGAAGRFVALRVFKPVAGAARRFPPLRGQHDKRVNNAALTLLLERVLLPGLLLSMILNVLREAWLRARGLSASPKKRRQRVLSAIGEEEEEEPLVENAIAEI